MMGTLYSDFVARWKDCRRCPLWEGRTKIVLAKGALPCDVLFVGEAPGTGEDVVGLPFVGPAGRVLDDIIAEAFAYRSFALAFTNLVCCIPVDEEGDKGEPSDAEIRKCQPRLAEFVKIARPKMVVAVGRLSGDWLGSKRRGALELCVPIIEVVHPAAILRANDAQRGMMRRRAVVVLRTAILEHLDAGTKTSVDSRKGA